MMIGASFLYFFLPIFSALYLISPKPVKSRLVLVTGAGLICFADPMGLIAMAVCILSGYLFGVFIYNFRDKYVSKLLLVLEVMINSAVLLLFHRTAYDGSDLLTVLGHRSLLKSAVTVGAAVMPLHSIGYCVDVYRKRYRCEHRFIKVAEYISFFPVFAAGPILRYDKISPQLEERKTDISGIASGIRLIMLGMFKKLFISDTMLELWDDVGGVQISSLPALSAWIGILAFAFFVYFEVSAFSNIGCGIAAIMGIKLPSSFREPYRSHSFSDFCRKFNSTLYRWCKDYIYRSIKHRGSHGISEFFAILLTVLAACMWYGTSLRSVVFAAAMVFMLSIEKLLEKPLKKLPKIVRTLLFVVLLLTILPFMAFSDILDALGYIRAMYGGNQIAADVTSEYLISAYFLFVALCMLISGGVFGYVFKKKMFNNEYLQTIIQPVWVIALLIFCTAFLVSGNESLYRYMF